jgi:hypothetical protein
VCIEFISLLDASVAEEDIEGDYYYQEEEEEYPGHFANQGKPSFESYSKYLVCTLWTASWNSGVEGYISRRYGLC